MAVVSVNETWHGRKGSAEGHLVFSTRKSDLFVVSYARTFVVVTDDPLDGPQVVLAHADIPKAFDPYVTDTEEAADAICRKVDAIQRQEDPQTWDVTADYSTDMSAIERSPLLRPAEVKRSFRRIPKVLESAWGTATISPTIVSALMEEQVEVPILIPITNTAGDKFDPPLEQDEIHPVVTITRNEAAFNDVLAYNYQDAVNSDVFRGGLPGCWKVNGISGEDADENGLVYVKVTYEFEFDIRGWKHRPLNCGFHELDDSGKRKLILDPITGHAYATPQLLGMDGKRLPAGETPVFLEFDTYRSLPFSIFSLPQ